MTSSQAMPGDPIFGQAWQPVEATPPRDFQILQRVVVRLHFDPSFVSAVYSNPQQALFGLGLSEEQISQLRANDPRLWSADTQRASRTLKVLCEEFRSSTTLLLGLTRSLSSLKNFFASTEFHEGVQARGYMALSFASYLDARLRDAPSGAREVLALESALAYARREIGEARRSRDLLLERNAGRSGWLCQPGVLAIPLSQATFASIKVADEALFECSLIPAGGLCQDGPRLQALPESASQKTWYLIEPSEEGVSFAEVEERFGRLIARCRVAQSNESLSGALSDLDLSLERIQSMGEALQEAGLLRQVH